MQDIMPGTKEMKESWTSADIIKHNQELISVSEEKDKGNKRSNRVDGHDG